MQESEDIDLLREYLDHNSEEAFTALVTRHINKVYSVALRHTGNPHQAEEITQVVFAILARKARSLGKRVIFEGWLYQTARLTALASVRSELRRARREQEAYMQTVSNEDESDPWPQIAPLLDTAIGSLNETDRHAVVLRFIYGKNMKEVGAVLGANEGATRLRLHRAMEKLRRFFDKRGIVSTSEILAGAISGNAVHSAPIGLAKTATALALAQAPAAASANLALIKTTLKIMFWTKSKTAIAGGAALLLAAGTPRIIKEIHRHFVTPPGPVPRLTLATASIKGQFFGPGELVDAGNTIPDAAWETRYWARAQGDYDAVLAATDPRAVAGAKSWMGDKATFGARSREEFATSLQGFQILARKDLSSDKVELKYQFTFSNWQQSSPPQQTKIVTLIKVNGAWLCAQPRTYDESWDAGSQPEPQS